MVKSKFVSVKSFKQKLEGLGATSQQANFLDKLIMFTASDRKKKFILRHDAELMFKSARSAGAANLVSLLSNQEQVSSFGKFLARHKKNTMLALRENTRFILNKFSDVLGELNKTKIAGYGFDLTVSAEQGCAFCLRLKKKEGKCIALLNFNFDVSEKGKPVLVAGNFQGFGGEKDAKAFQKELKKAGVAKGEVHVFDFMLGKLLSKRKGKEVKAIIPEIKPNKAIVESRLEEKGIPVTEENIKVETQRIINRYYGIHNQVFAKAGFRRKRKRDRFLVLQRRQQRKH
ncbi:hypothetical protein KKB11_07705 [Candidatus Micrarchaeota archaeon]|nr:hypothetical protein [Candidatus Micrarchaeota archaeon]